MLLSHRARGSNSHCSWRSSHGSVTVCSKSTYLIAWHDSQHGARCRTNRTERMLQRSLDRKEAVDSSHANARFIQRSSAPTETHAVTVFDAQHWEAHARRSPGGGAVARKGPRHRNTLEFESGLQFRNCSLAPCDTIHVSAVGKAWMCPRLPCERLLLSASSSACDCGRQPDYPDTSHHHGRTRTSAIDAPTDSNEHRVLSSLAFSVSTCQVH